MNLIDWRTKGFWWPGPAVPFEEFAAARHSLFGGAFTWPVMVARRTAIEHNIATLAGFCARNGLLFAPHGKTTMAPSLFAAQLRAGAWGITVATANQVLACRALGVPRVLLANVLLDPVALRWVAGEVEQGFDFLSYVDSLAGVETMAAAARDRPLRVLVELGYPGGRTGCRDLAELITLAETVAATPRLELAGIAAYEGGLPDSPHVSAYLETVRSAAVTLQERGLLGGDAIVTAGGSSYFDLVAQHLPGPWLTVLRSGAYVSHDDGFYRHKTPFRRVPHEGTLDAALEVWAQVTSAPEDGLAIVGMGKREAPYDEGLPVAQRIRRRDGVIEEAKGVRLTRLNDHHAYLELDATRLAPGDLVCFGISHPCTAFDKWQAIPVVEDDYTVTEIIRTHF